MPGIELNLSASKIFIAKGLPPKDLQQADPPEIVALRHPKTQQIALFWVKTGKIFEVTHCKAPHSSWFIDNNVKSDGGWYLVSEIDPVFLALPYLIRHCAKDFLTLDEIFAKEAKLESAKLLSENENLKKYLQFAAEFKDNMYKFNEEKLFAWLNKKLTNIVADTDLNKQCALDMLSKYLPDDIFKKFRQTHEPEKPKQAKKEEAPVVPVVPVAKETNLDDEDSGETPAKKPKVVAKGSNKPKRTRKNKK